MTAKRSITQRSAISNGSTLLPGVDGRSAWVRRLRDLIDDHTADLGGSDHVSAAEASIIRRAAVLSVELEIMEAQFATAGCASRDDLAAYATVANSLRRLLESVGLERRQRDVTPSVAEFLADHARQKVTHTPEPADAPSAAPAPGNAPAGKAVAIEHQAEPEIGADRDPPAPAAAPPALPPLPPLPPVNG